MLKYVVAKEDVFYNDSNGRFCTKGKRYDVISKSFNDNGDFDIVDDDNDRHNFSQHDCEYFELHFHEDGVLKDSGERIKYSETSAVREPTTNKGRFDLLEFQMLQRVALHLQRGAEKYSEHNWRKGLPVSRCCDSALRHLSQYIDGQDDEDHLAACICNLMFIMFYEKHLPEMQDLPTRKGSVECTKDQ